MSVGDHNHHGLWVQSAVLVYYYLPVPTIQGERSVHLAYNMANMLAINF